MCAGGTEQGHITNDDLSAHAQQLCQGSCADRGTFIPQIGQNCFLPFFCCHDETLPLNNMLYYTHIRKKSNSIPGKNQPAVCRRC